MARELAGRSSLTLLAVPDGDLPQSPSAFAAAAGADLADVLRYHVLLEYISPADLRRLPASGKLFTTLFQTTGRASADLGAVNVTAAGPSLGVVRSPAPFPASNATVLGPVTSVPYNLSVLAVSGLIVPSGFDLAASDARPAAAPVNITRVLADARGFNMVASMLEASGVAEEFEGDERGAGITVFVPTDEAFASVPAGDRKAWCCASGRARAPSPPPAGATPPVPHLLPPHRIVFFLWPPAHPSQPSPPMPHQPPRRSNHRQRPSPSAPTTSGDPPFASHACGL